MKKYSLDCCALAALVAGPAMAADLSVKRPAPPPYRRSAAGVAFYNWTGCYVGGHAGGLWVSKEWFDRQPGSATFGSRMGAMMPTASSAACQAGCDYQVRGRLGASASPATTPGPTPKAAAAASCSPASPITRSVKSLASVTGRIGYAWDRFLGYVKGGGAWERDNYDFSLAGVVIGDGQRVAQRLDDRRWRRIRLHQLSDRLRRIQLLRLRQPRDLRSPVSDGPFVYGIDETKSVVKAGLNLRFGGWGGPPWPGTEQARNPRDEKLEGAPGPYPGASLFCGDGTDSDRAFRLDRPDVISAPDHAAADASRRPRARQQQIAQHPRHRRAQLRCHPAA